MFRELQKQNCMTERCLGLQNFIPILQEWFSQKIRISSKDKKGVESFDGMVAYTLTLNFKDGKFKYEISRIHWKQASYYDVSKWMDTKDQYYKEV